MTFQTVPFNTTGPTYLSRSKPLSSQQTRNWYQQLSQAGKDQYTLMAFPGLKRFTYNDVIAANRGLWRMAETLYQVKGTRLYKIDKLGGYTDIGEIPGAGRCIIADDGVNMFIVSDLKVWQYSTDTGLITQVTDPEIDGAKSVDFINNQFIYTKDRTTTISDVGNGASASGLNVIGAETKPDDLVRDYVFQQTIWRFGTRTIEAWYNSGVGNPPIDRLDGQIFDIGLAAIGSVAQTDNAFYWLGDDNVVYQGLAGSKQIVSSDAISNAIEKASDKSNAVGFTFTIQGQNFYALTIPDINKTFVLSESLGVNGWFEVGSGIGDSNTWQANSLISCYGLNVAADESNGRLYTLDLDTFTNNQDPLQRRRVTQVADGRLIGGSIRDRVQMSELTISMETGQGLIEGQGDNPRIMIEYSDDGGRTWASGSWARTGRLGEFVLVVKFNNLKSFYSRMFRFTTSDPVNYSVYSASISLRLAGR